MCGSGWPGTFSPPASASQGLGLEACATIPSICSRRWVDAHDGIKLVAQLTVAPWPPEPNWTPAQSLSSGKKKGEEIPWPNAEEARVWRQPSDVGHPGRKCGGGGRDARADQSGGGGGGRSATNAPANRKSRGVVAAGPRQRRRHGRGLRAGPEGAAEAEGRRRGRRHQAEEEEEGQGHGEASGSHGLQQEERGGEAARPGPADAGAGGLREDAGEAANGKDPEESIENPQAESGGLQQTPGHTDRALRHPQSQLDQVERLPAGPAPAIPHCPAA